MLVKGKIEKETEKVIAMKKSIIVISIIAALSVITAVIALMGADGRNIKKNINLGQKYMDEMNYEEAIACFEKVLDIDPMSVEAYLGIADAYVGLGKYDLAIETLERGIDILEEYINNNDKNTDAVKKDIARLQEKLEEIQQIKDNNEAPNIGMDENQGEKTEDDLYILSLPYVEVQPVLDCMNNVWGRSWTEWTVEEFVETHQPMKEYTNNSDWFATPDEYTHQGHDEYAASRENGNIYIAQDRYCNDVTNGKKFGAWMRGLEIDDQHIKYTQYITTYAAGCEIDMSEDGLYDYATSNGITTTNSAVRYFGLIEEFPESETRKEILINTEYGVAMATIFDNEGGGEYSNAAVRFLKLEDFEEYPGLTICFEEEHWNEDGFMIWIEIKNKM